MLVPFFCYETRSPIRVSKSSWNSTARVEEASNRQDSFSSFAKCSRYRRGDYVVEYDKAVSSDSACTVNWLQMRLRSITQLFLLIDLPKWSKFRSSSSRANFSIYHSILPDFVQALARIRYLFEEIHFRRCFNCTFNCPVLTIPIFTKGRLKDGISFVLKIIYTCLIH